MKLTLKLMLVVSLFSSIVLADDGNMGNGGKTCPPGQTTCRAVDETKDTNQTDSILGFIQNYLFSIFE